MQNKIFDIQTTAQFEEVALEVFNYQMKNNPIYSSYAKLLLKGREPVNIHEIPFLPISDIKPSPPMVAILSHKTTVDIPIITPGNKTGIIEIE